MRTFRIGPVPGERGVVAIEFNGKFMDTPLWQAWVDTSVHHFNSLPWVLKAWKSGQRLVKLVVSRKPTREQARRAIQSYKNLLEMRLGDSVKLEAMALLEALPTKAEEPKEPTKAEEPKEPPKPRRAKRKNVRQFRVTLSVPEGAPISDVKEYIEEAVATWKGQLSPDDPLFYLDRDSVKVTQMRGRRS